MEKDKSTLPPGGVDQTISYYQHDLRNRVRCMVSRTEEGRNLLQSDEIEDWTLVESTIELLSNSLRRVEMSLPFAQQQCLPMQEFNETIEAVVEADDITTLLRLMLRKSGANQQQNNLTPTFTESTKTKQLEIKVQTFSGDRTKYQMFRKSVEIAYERKKATPAEKVLFTLNHLDGKAEKIVENVPATKEGLELLWQLLDLEYDDPTRTRNEIYLKLEELPEAKDDAITMKETLDSIEAALRVIEIQDKSELVAREETYKRLILSKFPNTMVRYITQPGKVLTLEQTRERLRTVLTDEVRRQVFLEPLRRAKTKKETISIASTATQPTSTVILKTAVVDKGSTANLPRRQPQQPCPFCKKAHWADQCPNVTSIEERIALLSNCCTICLREDHRKDNCTSNRLCFYCRERGTHHSSICPKKQLPKTEPTAKQTPMVNETANFVTGEGYGTYITVIARIRNPISKRVIQARIFIDPGTSCTYVRDSMAKAIDLELGSERIIKMKRFNDQFPLKFPSSVTKFEIITDDKKVVPITANTAPEITDKLPMISPKRFLGEHPEFSTLKFADIGEDWPIDIMVGNDYAFRLLTCRDKIDVGSLQLLDTIFGYVISGHSSGEPSSHTANFFATATAIERLSSLDSLGIRDAHRTTNDEEEAALKQFYEHVTFTEGRYEVPLLWRTEPLFPGTFGLAVGRLRSTVKRLQHNRYVLDQYNAIFTQQLESGIIEEVHTTSHRDRVYYIPHQAVIDMSKTTTPIRIVFDASAKASKTAPSLNEAMYKGVTKLEDMAALVIRLRTYRTALVADIEKAYHMLRLRPADRDYCRFLWVRDPSQPLTGSNIIQYRFCRIAFGLTSSQFLLNAVIKNHIQKYQNEFSDQLLNDFYVDNLITGTQSEEEAIRLHHQSIELFERCSMNLRCWATNSQIVQQQFRSGKVETAEEIKVLGIKWHMSSDRIRLPEVEFDLKKEPTLRFILKQTARVYDPVGWFSPVCIRSKILMQEIRIAGYCWDDKLPANFVESWTAIAKDLNRLSTVNLNRYIQLDEEVELHAFSDASAKAYGAAIYVKTKQGIQLLFSKARVAPIRKLTIPKLELLAATIAVRALTFVQNTLRNTKVTQNTLWTDSKCVIAQVRTTKLLPVYVDNRVKEIRAHTNLRIKYVPTKQNIADIVSRGIPLEDLPEEWWNGPHFLSQPEEHWPDQQTPDYDSEIQKEVPMEISCLVRPAPQLTQLFSMKLENYGSLKRVLGIAAVILRFLSKRIPTFRSRVPAAEREPRSLALYWWIKEEQNFHYYDVFQAIEKQTFNATVKKFQLIMDKQGLLRCRGRFEFQTSPPHTRYPILLPRAKDSQLVKLIIRQTHENNYHTGTNHTLAALRRQFWLPLGRKSVYHIVTACPRCKRYTARPFQQPLESELPLFRVTPTQKIWQHIGLDVFGPITVEQEKTWILLFTCMATRAISLESLESMSAEHTMLAFKAFIARRATPEEVLSDPGSQFQPVIDILKWNLPTDIIWNPLPAKASWMGGTYERLIGITKSALEKTLHKRPLTRPMLRTVLFELENVVNSRPISYVENDVGFEALTPNHFLSVPQVQEDASITQQIPTDRAFLQALWRYVSNLRAQFWDAWSQQYLAHLRERHTHDRNHFKKNTVAFQPAVGNIVLVADKLTKRRNWSIARITKLPTSSDGKIRSAQLYLASGTTISRPIQDVYPLEDEPIPTTTSRPTTMDQVVTSD